MSTLPLWVDVVTAVLAVAGSLAALIGALGLLRLPTFFQRAHAPTLGSTGGAWSLALATALQQSFLKQQVFVHALLIPLFVAATAPVASIFLVRAALFRSRRAGAKDVPPITSRSEP